MGTADALHAVRLRPRESCSCPVILCCGSQSGYGVVKTAETTDCHTDSTDKNKNKRADRAIGCKKPHLGVVDVVVTPVADPNVIIDTSRYKEDIVLYSSTSTSNHAQLINN